MKQGLGSLNGKAGHSCDVMPEGRPPLTVVCLFQATPSVLGAWSMALVLWLLCEYYVLLQHPKEYLYHGMSLPFLCIMLQFHAGVVDTHTHTHTQGCDIASGIILTSLRTLSGARSLKYLFIHAMVIVSVQPKVYIC